MSTPNDRRAQYVARRLDALVALVRHHPYSDDSTLLSLAEHDPDLGGLTSARLVDMLQGLLESKRIHRRGQGRHACWFTSDADKVLAERQADRDATGKLERVTVPTPPAPTDANSPTTSMDGRQLARLAAPAPKAGAALVIGVDALLGERPTTPPMLHLFVERAARFSSDLFSTAGHTATTDELRAVGVREEDIVDDASDSVHDEPPVAAPVEPVAEVEPPQVEDLFIPTAQLPMPGTRMERIRNYVIANPGSSVTEIRRDTLISNTDQLANTMCRNHRGLRWEVVDGVRRFWAIPARDVAPPAVTVETAPAVTRAGDSRRTFTVDPDSATGILVAWVVANPGHTARQVGEACGIDPKSATTMLAYHHKRGVLPLLGRRTNAANIWCWYSAEALAALEAAGESDMVNETNNVEQLDDQAAVRDLETAPGCSGVVAPRGVVGVDPSEVAQVTSDAPPAGAGDGSDPTVESGVAPPEAPVAHDDGAGPLEVDPTASEAPTEDDQLIADLTQRVMELEERCDSWEEVARSRGYQLDDHKAAELRIRTQLAKLLGLGVNEESADVMVDRFVRWIERIVADLRHKERCRDEEARQSRARILRMLGSAPGSDDGWSLDELLTMLESRVRNLADARDSAIDSGSASYYEVTRLARFLEREPRKPREGETPVDTAIRFLLEDAHRLRMVAHLAVGGEVLRG